MLMQLNQTQPFISLNNMIAIGNSEISAAYVGNKEVLKVYCGNAIVYEKLLYDTEVEYIQSDEYACIDLGVQGNNTNLSYELLDYPLEFGTWSYLFGNYADEESNVTRIMTPNATSNAINFNFNSKANGGTKAVERSIFINNKYRHFLTNRKLFYNQNSKATLTTLGDDNNHNVALFNALKTTNPQSFLKLRVYWMRIWDGNTLLKDFIPVSINGKGALFDKVSGVVHNNLGGNDIIVGPSLPTNYDSEVEYLQSDGSAYIDTEVNGDNDNLEFHIEYSCSTHVNYGGIFGNYIGEGINVWRLILDASSPSILFNTNSATGGGSNQNNHAINSKNTLLLNKNKIVINGVETALSGITSGTVNNSPIALFNRSVVNPVFERDIGLKIYKFQIYDNGTLIKDFIPVRVGTVGYMYDKVESRFYRNRGYGDFTLGSDVNN